MARALFVDFENVHKLDLSRVPADFRVFGFFGANQLKSWTAMAPGAAKHPGGFVTIGAAGSGRDALDFMLAYQLGVELTRDPALECTIYSGDTGFDPLIRHLRKLGHTVTKTKPRLQKNAKAAAPARYADAVALLKKGPKNLPGTRTKLLKHLGAQLAGLEPAGAEAIVEHLLALGAVKGGKTGALTYALPRKASS